MPSTPPPAEAEPEGLLASAATGARFVWSDKVLRALAIAMFLLLAFIAVDNVALVFLVRETLGGSAVAYGVIEAVFGVGMLVGTVWILRGSGGGWAATAPLGSSPAALSTFGSLGGAIAPSVAVLARFEAVAGAGNGIEVVAMETIIQQRVPRGMIGRVYGFISSAELARPRRRDGLRRPRRRRHLAADRLPDRRRRRPPRQSSPSPRPCSAPRAPPTAGQG